MKSTEHLYAHTPSEGTDLWQLLEDHLKQVADLSASFAEQFTARELGRCIGFLHDLGKASTEFQTYLKQCHSAKLRGDKPPVGRFDHKLAGAVLASKSGSHTGLLAIPILGHHGGMPDHTDTDLRTNDLREAERVKPVLKIASELLPSDLQYPSFPPQFLASNPSCEMFLRMLYSCLVDADSLDTEQHWNKEKATVRGCSLNIGSLWVRFQNNQANIQKRVAATHINALRRQIYNDCLSAAEGHQGVFKLTVPTGGGKTRSGMAFALKHAVKRGLRRVIVAIPYTSIIDQNAREYRKIFWPGSVLEHHSALEVPDSEQYSESHLKMELAAENWDMPVVVTTTVQLFESLFSNKRSKCRKLHNLAGSVIILDEVQTLPLGLLQPILDMLKELVANYRVSLVLSTATQPAFSGISPYLEGFPECVEIVHKPERYFQALKRVEYSVEHEPWSWDKVADKMRERKQVLCVLNSRKDAVALFKLLDDPEALHLSTLMCPAHRRKVLCEIRSRLDKGLPCRVVSTQVVEAGVDLDFPCVMRAMGPLDRIVQAAGRCNREGRMGSLGEVIVFQPEEGKAPKGAYATAMAEALRMLQRDVCDLHDPEVFDDYFSALWQDSNLDSEAIVGLRKRLNYPKVASEFKMIEGDTVSVVTQYDESRTSGILEHAQWSGGISKGDWRTLQTFSVSIYKYDFERYKRQGLVKEVSLGLWQWQGIYNHSYGISEDLPDPTDLIA